MKLQLLTNLTRLVAKLRLRPSTKSNQSLRQSPKVSMTSSSQSLSLRLWRELCESNRLNLDDNLNLCPKCSQVLVPMTATPPDQVSNVFLVGMGCEDCLTFVPMDAVSETSLCLIRFASTHLESYNAGSSTA